MIEEVPSPINFADIAQARAWTADTVARRPYRPRFFERFCLELSRYFHDPIKLIELGSGPGHLAREILSNCSVETYSAVDFSPVMHSLAREHLGPLASRATYIVADFRHNEWLTEIAPADALVTMQAAHEMRHKSRLPQFLRHAHAAIRPGGMILFCDHYAEAGGMKRSDLFVFRDQQPELLSEAGFCAVRPVHDEGGMALYAAFRP
jgi:SAM-dependent methyltransferase